MIDISRPLYQAVAVGVVGSYFGFAVTLNCPLQLRVLIIACALSIVVSQLAQRMQQLLYLPLSFWIAVGFHVIGFAAHNPFCQSVACGFALPWWAFSWLTVLCAILPEQLTSEFSWNVAARAAKAARPLDDTNSAWVSRCLSCNGASFDRDKPTTYWCETCGAFEALIYDLQEVSVAGGTTVMRSVYSCAVCSAQQGILGRNRKFCIACDRYRDVQGKREALDDLTGEQGL